MNISFSFIATFVSLIYGLALAHGLSCMAEYIQNLKELKNYWVWWVWALFLLLLSNGFWVSIYNIWHDVETWKMTYVVFISFQSCLFYLIYYIFFNHLKELENNDLKKDYYKNKNLFFLLLTIAVICMLNLSEIITGELTFFESLKKYPPIIPSLTLILIFTNKKKIHAIFSILMLSFFILQILAES